MEMINLAGLDATQINQNIGLVIPAGEYMLMIVDSERKANKAGDGEYINATLEVIDGPYKGAKLWERMTIKHNSKPNAVQIGMAALARILIACGRPRPSHFGEVHNVPFIGEVAIRKQKATDEYEESQQNVLKSCRPANPNPPQASAWNHAPAPAPQGPPAMAHPPVGFQAQPAPQNGYPTQPAPAQQSWFQGANGTTNAVPARNGWEG